MQYNLYVSSSFGINQADRLKEHFNHIQGGERWLHADRRLWISDP